MLRITETTKAEGGRALRLEGAIAGPWVELLRGVVASTPGVISIDAVAIDFMDADGIALLREVVGMGVKVDPRSTFVASVLGGEP